MNDSEVRQFMDAAERLIRPHLRRSTALRECARLFGQWLGEQARAADDAAAAAGPSRAIADGNEPIETTPADDEKAPKMDEAQRPSRPQPAISTGSVPLKIGDAIVHLPIKGTTEEIGRARQAAIEPAAENDFHSSDWPQGEPTDLSLVGVRCRLKADSCRLFIEKRRAELDSEPLSEILSQMNEMIAKAKSLPDCFLWVFWRERTQPADAELTQIAVGYDTLAQAAALMQRVDELADVRRGDDEVEAVHLLAEADSALRVALLDSWLVSDDRDQQDVHFWLRDASRLRHIFIRRYMTIDDPADPGNAADLQRRIAAALARLDQRENYAKSIREALNRIRYHAGQLVRSDPDEASSHWSRIDESITTLASLGVAAHDRRLVEALGPQAASTWAIAGDSSRALATVVEQARALGAAEEPQPDLDGSPRMRSWSDSVLEVREILRGKRMVIIGGEPRPEAIERLTNAFELSAAEWAPLTEHGTSAPMRGPISRSDTAVVIVIVKLAGHVHADMARQWSAQAGRPCVLLSGGYNPERVANEILQQASERLSA